MRILISPAKLMNVENKSDLLKPTNPKFIKDAEHIQKYLKEENPKFLKKLMGISDKLAQENWERNQNWNGQPSSKDSAMALYVFTGEVYRGLDAKTLSQEPVKYLEENLRILSGLYGFLKPSDKVMLYRLEMGCGFSFDDYKNLYQFWTEKVTDQLNKELKSDDFVLNLASNEYLKVIDQKKLKCPFITFEFREIRNDQLKTIVVYTKHARGLVARFCAENNITKLEDVKSFNSERYLFSDKLSTENNFVFTR